MTAMPPLDAATALGRDAVPGALPAGADPDGTPAFEAVMAEIGKLSQMGAAPVAWDVVADNAVTVLRDHAKDLRMAAYLARALLERDGLPGLARGLDALAAIVETHWAACWPAGRRPRGRAAAFLWLAERVTPVLAARFVDSTDGPILRGLEERLARLDEALAPLLGDAAPDLGDVARALRDKLREADAANEGDTPPAGAAPAAAPAASSAPAAKAAPAPVPSSAPGLAALPTLDATSERVVKQVFTEAAAALRPHDLGNPVFYHMVRYATWRGISEAPPASPEGRTQLAPVPADRVAQYEKMLSAGHHADLIAGAETSIARNPFWLTGQRLTDRALAALGHEAARAALRHEVRTFLERVPSVRDLKFSDGSPFADAATQDWLAAAVLSAAPVAAGSVPTPAGGGDWRALLDGVTAEAAADDLLDLLRRLDAALCAEADPRRRFLWGMALARACLDGGHAALARAQLERLDDTFTGLGLHAWEPALGADLAAALAEARGGAPAPVPHPKPTPPEKD